MNNVLLIDGANCFIRCYCAFPGTNMNGEPFGGVIGFLRSMKMYIDKCKPSKVIVAWDGKGGSRKRRKLIESYKKNRKPIKLNRVFNISPEEIQKNKIYQRVKLDHYLKMLPITQIVVEDLEADDIIAYLVKYFQDERKVIVSGDKDFYQLLNKDTIIFYPSKKIFITAKQCLEEFGICPINFALAKAFVGDVSDNIKGIRGIGFARLLKKFPFFAEPEKIELEQVFEFCKKDEKKYKQIIDAKEIVIKNLKAMQLYKPIVGCHGAMTIKESLSKELKFNSTNFKVEMLKDGVTDMNDSFFHQFRILSLS